MTFQYLFLNCPVQPFLEKSKHPKMYYAFCRGFLSTLEQAEFTNNILFFIKKFKNKTFNFVLISKIWIEILSFHIFNNVRKKKEVIVNITIRFKIITYIETW